MKLVRVLVLLPMAAGTAFGQPTPDRAKSDLSAPVVEGRVVTVLGVPLDGVSVKAQPFVDSASLVPGTIQPSRSPVTSTTDLSGKFELEGLQPGLWAFVGVKSGYSFGWHNEGMPVRVAAGQRLSGVSIALEKGGAISGRVVGPNREPFTSGSVTLRGWTVRDGRQLLTTMSNSSSIGPKGQFEFRNVPTGRYYVLASIPSPSRTGGVSSSSRDDGEPEPRAYVPTFYPASPEIKQAVPVTVTSGQESRDLEIRMAQTRVFRIKGKVVDDSGRSVPQATLALAQPLLLDAPNSARRLVSRDGSFEFSTLVPGEYFVVAGSSRKQAPGFWNGAGDDYKSSCG